MNTPNLFQVTKPIKSRDNRAVADGNVATRGYGFAEVSSNPIFDDHYEEYRTTMSFQVYDDHVFPKQSGQGMHLDNGCYKSSGDHPHVPLQGAAYEVEAEEVDGDGTEKFKTKMMSMWNNVKYGWSMKIKTNFSYEKEIWLLGTCYHKQVELKAAKRKITEEQAQMKSMEKFKQDFMSRLWLTYRREFPMLAGSKLTTDCGWGCMLRSGQMLLGQALVCHFLTRDWRIHDLGKEKERTHRMIVKWFADCPNQSSPFSLHRLVEVGESLGKKAGDWYGPASVAQILRHAMEIAAQEVLVLDGICIYVAKDCTIYKDDVIDLCTEPSKCSSAPTSPREKVSECCKKHLNEVAVEQNPLSANHFQEVQQAMPRKDSSRHAGYGHKMLSDDVHASPDPGHQCCKMSRNDGEKKIDIDFFNEESPPSYSCALLRSSSCSSVLSICTYKQDEVSPSSLPPDNSCNVMLSTCTKTSKWRGVVIFVPVRLGGEKMNSIYYSCIRRILMHKNCIGIIGGRPRHSLYFVGWQDDKLIYLDPHYCQETVDVRKHDFPLESFHCSSPRKMSFSRMDPSCAFGFYCRTREEFMDFTRTITKCVVPEEEKSDYPMFVISEGHSKDNSQGLYPGSQPDKLLKIKHCIINSQGTVEAEIEGEDFVLI